MTLCKDITNFLSKLEKGRVLRGLNEIMLSAAGFKAIPLEQLKGDIARAGFPVERTLALDAENRRLFFTDVNGGFMFAEYGRPEEAFQIKRIGSQSDIAKEYDVVDPDDEPRMDFKTTHYEEDYTEEDPGMIPSGTPGDKPEDEDGRGFGDEELDVLGKALAKVRAVSKQSRTGLGLADDPQVEEAEDRVMGPEGLDEVIVDLPPDKQDDLLGELREVVKQPPREGLVPQTGDPEHPGRWVKPESQGRPGRRPLGTDPATEGSRAAREENQARAAERAAREQQPTAEGELDERAEQDPSAGLSQQVNERIKSNFSEIDENIRSGAIREAGRGIAWQQRLFDKLGTVEARRASLLLDRAFGYLASGDRSAFNQEYNRAREVMGQAAQPEQKASMSANPVERARRLRNSLQTSNDVKKRGAHKQRPGHGNWRRAQTTGGRNGR